MMRYFLAAVVCVLTIPEDAYAGVLKPYEDPSSEVTKQISFLLFTRKNRDTAYTLQLEDDENYGNSPFNPKNPTVFFIHGFGGRGEGGSGLAIKNAYLGHGHFNMILVDWKPLAKMPWYANAIRHSAVVGRHTAAMVKWLEHKRAISIPTLHIIGFSLGAHVSAFVGEELAKNQSELIGRITGLDPAGPVFDKFAVQSNGLGKEDAKFVDVIHTNSRFLGLHLAIGHVDFYVNYGRAQPGCGIFTIKCSHYRAWEYYAESLSNPCGFPADRCTTWKPLVSGCERERNVLMGVATSKNIEGVFIVETNEEAPFAKITTNLKDIVVTSVQRNETSEVYTVAEEAEIGLENLADYCTGNFTKLGSDKTVDGIYEIVNQAGDTNDITNELYTITDDKR